MTERLKTKTIPFKCPHCGKEYDLEVAPKPDKMGDYRITCPDCEKPLMKQLPGEIISGPTPRKQKSG
jgi:DNA-directed RNA polymerase subunit RPC12/RpoP